MAQKNAAYKVPTALREAEAEGEVDIAIEGTKSKKPTLETELVSNGWRDVENEVKRFIYEHQSKANCNQQNEIQLLTDIYEENYEVKEEVDKLVDASLKYAEIYNEKEKELLRDSILLAFEWDDKKRELTYNAPEIKGTSTLLKTTYDDIFNDKQKSNLIETEDHIKYRSYKRAFFGQNVSEKDRQAILQYAYLLKMNSQKTEMFLTKQSFSEKIRWENPWELAAAYEIECNPAREEDRASNFQEAIETRVEINRTNPKVPENRNYLEFIRKKEQREFDDWVQAYEEHSRENKKDAFLCHWAWLLIAAENKKGNLVVPKISQEELQCKLPSLYVSLNRFAEAFADYSTHKICIARQEERDLRRQIIEVMKRRDLRLVAAVYSYSQLDYGEKRKRVEICDRGRKIQFVIPGNGETLFPSIRGLSAFGTKIDGRHCCRMDRSAIIGLGLDLALTKEGINHLLAIGGYYKLYARDFYEYFLIKTLSRMKRKLMNDSYRFGADSCRTISREINDVDAIKNQLRQAYKSYADESLNKLSEKNRTLYLKKAPKWVKESIWGQ